MAKKINVKTKSKTLKPSNRLFLVVADDSKELHQALYYAARRAATAGGEIALFRCIEPIEGQLWGGVTEIMESEAEQSSKKLLNELSEYCEKLGAPKPRTFVRKGIVHEELFNLIDKEEATLKKFRKKGDSIALEPANKNYKTQIYGPDRITIQGKMCTLIRKY